MAFRRTLQLQSGVNRPCYRRLGALKTNLKYEYCQIKSRQSNPTDSGMNRGVRRTVWFRCNGVDLFCGLEEIVNVRQSGDVRHPVGGSMGTCPVLSLISMPDLPIKIVICEVTRPSEIRYIIPIGDQ